MGFRRILIVAFFAALFIGLLFFGGTNRVGMSDQDISPRPAHAACDDFQNFFAFDP